MFYTKLTDTCHNLLKRDPSVLNYLKNRNINKDTIKKYKIGSFPRDLRKLFDQMSAPDLKHYNIIWNSSKSPFKLYPLVIPIRDVSGKPVAIGCRTLMSDLQRQQAGGIPKYYNSRYKKTNYLFGLDKAVSAIRKKNIVYIVEGYMDVLSSHQNSIYNVVGTCGTLFSKRQLITLTRYTNNICFIFDRDPPGKEASRQIQKKFSNHPIFKANLNFKFVPQGFKDLDEYINNGGNLNILQEAYK